jgi:hypothetical protein
MIDAKNTGTRTNGAFITNGTNKNKRGVGSNKTRRKR